MCTIHKMTGTACLSNPAGTKGTGYMAPAEEFAAWPAFTTPGTAGDGNTVVLSGNFSFTGAGTGNGYFRSFPMLLEKGDVKYNAVGGTGSKSIEAIASFYIVGLDKVQLEWLKSDEIPRRMAHPLTKRERTFWAAKRTPPTCRKQPAALA